MNERIRELAIQSGLPTALDYHQKRYKKFVELIVKECGVALNPMSRDMVSRGQAFNLIKEHFEVEE
jgi:hypothetical protein